MLRAFAGHTIDVDVLVRHASACILDVGSRGGCFREEIKSLRFDHTLTTGRNFSPFVVQVDPDENLKETVHVAVVGDGSVTQTYARYSTGEGNHLGSGYGIPGCSPIGVPCMTIGGISKMLAIERWAVVKLDCEGSEFGILENWPGPIATQISVEFHDFQNPKRWNDQYFAWLFSQLDSYEVVQHEATMQGDQRGHWDTLLILKEALRR
jgi:hypothetical protein